ncbi:TRAP transporter large permease [Billgrantia desiderata]|uniref:TRAP transporter large permease protein n=1 Tax=Billgrantia desiderata TaxID=52021 RepID=A0ABS9B6M8_9GAMM|nr:TRAP transporter large permease subunit [Halomonas desiderata]MCE8013242.1 TRAP transporter large permease subunit [Halomonas desiderata]MCE8028292.1 TRAP transporter large permease subunit [Halomonas desiderata]MCE8042910.1 TRAP transporter large permease subunit [Halomonas desiderata]MCE8047574.1 TRAP transporter large permease subunit [Halomonas desiderata]NIC37654.1 TRAP transporter large permease subunit [Halomonas desiderata]
MPLEYYALAMIVAFFVLVMTGIPVGFVVAFVGFVFGFIGFDGWLFELLPSRIYGVVANYTLLAIPLFVFMGVMLERSKIAERMLDVIGHLCGGLPGGMALAVIIVGVLLGAATGIVGAAIVTLTLMALPTLVRRGYKKTVACGTICAAGTLGQIIPPSLVLLVLADIMNLSVGSLFAAALVPGLLLAGMYLAYLLLLAFFFSADVPAIDEQERAAVSKRELGKDFVKVVVPPLLLIFAVLGSIIGGVAAPTEAASVGAVGALLLTVVSGRLTLPVLSETVKTSLRISCMIFFVLIASQVFALAFRGLDGEFLIEAMFEWVPGGMYGTLIFMLLLIFFLGFFLEWIQISYIAVPLFLPFLASQGDMSMVWVAILIAMNLQTSFLTPPFGWSLLFMKGVAPPGITTGDIYKGAVPFVLIQILALALIIVFPDVVLWLPRVVGW